MISFSGSVLTWRECCLPMPSISIALLLLFVVLLLLYGLFSSSFFFIKELYLLCMPSSSFSVFLSFTKSELFRTIYGVIYITTFTPVSPFVVEEKSLPSSGMSPSIGTFEVVSPDELLMRPPNIIVSPLCTMAFVFTFLFVVVGRSVELDEPGSISSITALTVSVTLL